MAKKKGCYLYSKANHTICIEYNGSKMILPPFATKFKIADESKLGNIPNNVKKVSIESEVDLTNDTSVNNEGGK